jgi:hypothetical protein
MPEYKKTESTLKKVADDKKVLSDVLSEVVLVDKNGSETITTKGFYEKNKESFDLIGLKLK